jgi:hypothetical protein
VDTEGTVIVDKSYIRGPRNEKTKEQHSQGQHDSIESGKPKRCKPLPCVLNSYCFVVLGQKIADQNLGKIISKKRINYTITRFINYVDSCIGEKNIEVLVDLYQRANISKNICIPQNTS